jgi:pimeloyl-ACP methyl ester carboxylesterase
MKNLQIKTKFRNVSFSFVTAILAVLTLFTMTAVQKITAQKPIAKKTVVLVHGAFADGSSWEKIIPFLQAKGLNVIAVQNPLTSLADDVAATKRAIDAAGGEVILVGHSWGGAVITQAGTGDKVSALVYVAAFAPSKNESANESQKDYPKPEWLSQINVDSQGFVTLKPEAVANFFAQDLTAAETSLIAVTQGPTAFRCFEEKMTETAWSSKPSWYVVADQDRMINPDLERAYAKKMNAKMTNLSTSHVPMISKPKEVAEVILDAAGMKNK